MTSSRPCITGVSPAYFSVWLDRLFEGHEMAARKIGKSAYSVTGYVSTEKAAKIQRAESSLEQDFLTLLEYDWRVLRYATQPFKIHWKDVNGRPRRFTPDVAVAYHSVATEQDQALRTTIFEVKHRAHLNARWAEEKPRLKAAFAWAKDYGCRFKVITEREIRTPYLANARFLLRYKKLYGDQDLYQARLPHVCELLVRLGPTTPKALLEAIRGDEARRAEYIPYLWHLITLRMIGIDLSQPLTMASPIWPIGHTQWLSENWG